MLFHLMKVVTLAFAANCLLSACQFTEVPEVSSAELPFAELPKEQQEMYLAVMEHMLARYSKSSEQVCLSINGKDPPKDILDLFAQKGRSIEPASHHKDDIRVVCAVYGIAFVSSSKARIAAGYWRGSLAAEDGEFVIVKRRGTWRVVSWRITTVA